MKSTEPLGKGSRLLLTGALALALITTACSDSDEDKASEKLKSIMEKPRYSAATWNLLAIDIESGKVVQELNPDELAFTGSTRKLFSTGLLMNAVGADHRFETPVYRQGAVGADGALDGSLVLVGGGDLTFGGRQNSNDDPVAFEESDHNDANSLQTAILTPQDPLRGLNDLARQVAASGIRSAKDVAVDDRLFDTFRVPNGNLLITPVLVNENMVDVSLTPAAAGSPANMEWRPQTQAFQVENLVGTVPAGQPVDITLSGAGRIECLGQAGCKGTISGKLPVDFKPPFGNAKTFVATFRVEDPNVFARTAFIEALSRAGVTVSAPAVGPNPITLLSADKTYPADARVARFDSPPYSETAKLILKNSVNLGANLSVMLLGLTKGERTMQGSLQAERGILVGMGIKPELFDFPTNGSGSPDSRAASRAMVDLLVHMAKGPNAEAFRNALPILGTDGSLAGSGKDLPARGHVFAKTGTTLGDTGEVKAKSLAGYIEAKSGRQLAYAVLVNNAGKLKDIKDIAQLEEISKDLAAVSNVLYEIG